MKGSSGLIREWKGMGYINIYWVCFLYDNRIRFVFLLYQNKVCRQKEVKISIVIRYPKAILMTEWSTSPFSFYKITFPWPFLCNFESTHGMSPDNGGGSSSCLVASTAASSFSPSYSTVHEL